MDYNRIKIELERKGVSVRDLCYQIDITEQGLHQMIRNKSMKIEILERISYVLDLPMSYWFSEQEYINTPPIINNINNINNINHINNNANKYITTQIIHQKIDSLTKDLNNMLKELIPR